MSNVPHVNVNIWGKGVWNCQCVQTLKYKQKIHVWYKYKQKCMRKIPYPPYAQCFHVRIALKPPQKSVRWRYARECFFAFISKSVKNQCYNPYLFGKIFSSSTIWYKENGRIRKFIADNFSLKIDTFKLKCLLRVFEFFRFLYTRLYSSKRSFQKIWVVALIVNRFRDKRGDAFYIF